MNLSRLAKITCFRACYFAALFALFTGSAQAQLLQGSIDGNVTDASEAAVVGASVTVTNEQTNTTRATLTNQTGVYSFATLQPGTYTVTVTAPGFQTYKQTGVLVTINNVRRVDVALQVGQVTETVTVRAQIATLQADRAEVRAEISATSLRNLPVPTRNYQMLFATVPGVSPPQNAHSIPSNPARAVRFSVNGTSRSNNNTRIDGASSTNVWLPHMVGHIPSPEAIETVNIVTNSFDAEQGLAGGAAINVQIKSGGNETHGSLFEGHTNQHLKAYPWIFDRTQPKPKSISNSFGGTIGGPIKKDKLFYFASYQGSRQSIFGSRFVDIPSPEMRTGNLSASPTPIYDPATGTINGRGREPFENNLIPASRIDPAVQKMLPLWPDPNQPGQGRFGLNVNYLGGGAATFFRDVADAKVNWNANEKLSTFVRFGYLDYSMTNPQVFGPKLGGNRVHPTNSNPGTGFGNTYSSTASATYVFSPNFVVDGYFGYTLMDTNVEQDRLDENIGLDFLGIPGTNGTRRFEGGWPRFRIDGFEQVGINNNFMPYYRHDPQWQYVTNANWTKGNHNIRFGFDFYKQNLNHNQPEFGGSQGPASGGFRFRQGTTTLRGGPRGNDFNAFGSFLLGLPFTAGKIHQFPDDGYTTRTWLYSWYVRDRWQLSPKVTLSYGLRYEYFPMPTRADRGMERYDFENNKIWACGIGSIPKDCGVEIGKRDFAPRFGLAYRPSNSFVIRAGYGISNDPFNIARTLRTNYPIMFVQNLQAPNSRSFATTLRDGLPAVAPPDLGDGILDLGLTAGATTLGERYDRGYIHSWNLTLEKRLAWDFVGTVGYVGTRSIGQMYRLEQNYGLIGGGQSSQPLFQKFGRSATTRLTGILGTHFYDSLQARLAHRFSAGYQVNVSYTYSKTLGYGGTATGNSTGVDIPWLYGMNYGRLAIDQRHNLNTTWIAELPFGKRRKWAQKGIAAALAGGWQINGILSAVSGPPFTVTASGTSLNAPFSAQRADCLAKPSRIGARQEYYDRSAFARVREARFGTCGINNLNEAGVFNIDLGVFRQFQISEGMRLQFRTEVFNVSNTPHLGRPRNNINSGGFMRVDRTKNTGREGADERVFRFSLRLEW